MFDQEGRGLITAEDTYNLLFVRWNANNEYFKNSENAKEGVYLKSFDDQIFELFGFRPNQNQAILNNPDAEVQLTLFEYLDKINELAIKFRKKK